MIVVKLDDDLSTSLILQIDWETFFKNKHWHSRMNAHDIVINNKLIKESKVIFQKKVI
jgi:hypothetical protein